MSLWSFLWLWCPQNLQVSADFFCMYLLLRCSWYIWLKHKSQYWLINMSNIIVFPFYFFYSMSLLHPEQKCEYKIDSRKGHVFACGCNACDMLPILLLIYIFLLCVRAFNQSQHFGLNGSVVQVSSPLIQYKLLCSLLQGTTMYVFSMK